MKCPECDYWDAYIGLLWVHCRNADCRYYDLKYDTQRSAEDSGLLTEPEERPEVRLRRLRDLFYGDQKKK